LEASPEADLPSSGKCVDAVAAGGTTNRSLEHDQLGMNTNIHRRRRVWALLLFLSCVAILAVPPWTQSSAKSDDEIAASFEKFAKPFLQQNCQRCHEGDNRMGGVRVDELDAKFDDRHIAIWEAVRARLDAGTMPPKSAKPQPSDADRERMVKWIDDALAAARTRQVSKNGLIRRLTVAQYRNTLRELLLLEDDLTDILPADAVSKDGFLNNHERLELSPLLTETYFEIAEKALNRVIIDPQAKPSIQNFRLDFGSGINSSPVSERLVLGAGSTLLTPEDFTVTQLTVKKPFPFEPFFMRTKFRFIEGYQGNDTVRGWRDFDSIYHAVFADFRGSGGYPKGKAYGTVPEGLLLRPAIPNDELFGTDGTYGPKANFKIAVRELPDNGRFRVTVTAAKYDDGLLLDKGAAAAEGKEIVVNDGAAMIRTPGIYQVAIHPAPPAATPEADTSKLNEALAGNWTLDSESASLQLAGKAKLAESPFGKAASFNAHTDAVTIPTNSTSNIGTGDFTVSAWIKPRGNGAIISAGGYGTQGWSVDLTDRNTLQFVSAGAQGAFNGRVSSQSDSIRREAWQHLAVVVRRGKNETRIYVNGSLVGRGTTGAANLAAQGGLILGSAAGVESFKGLLDEVRLYQRALTPTEVQGLVLPGNATIAATPAQPRPMGRNNAARVPDVALKIGERQFTGSLQQPAFIVVRLAAGTTPISAVIDGVHDAAKITLTSLPATHESARRFLAFEQRLPKVGVYLGFRRDCGSSLVAVGEPQPVGKKLARYTFEGAMRNFPNAAVEKDNVNYLAGVRELGVRSEYTDGRDMPRLLIRAVEFEGPLHEAWPPPSYKNIFIDSTQKNNRPAYARQILRNFARRAYRRPITAAEEEALVAVYRNAAAAGRSFEESVKDALLVALTSPQFLFLIESSATAASEPLDNYELASKLSYFLWNSPPDARTLQLAAAGTLRKQLDAETERMIADPKFSRFINEFAAQWLSLDKFAVLEPDRTRFPKLTRETRTQLKREPVEFLHYLIRENLPATNLVQSDFIVANETVAGYYDLGDKTESGLRFVPIKHGRTELGGVLAQAAIMAGLSDGRESNPVKRGAWLARKIVAEPPADPPPNVPALKEATKNLTLRQRLEQHRDVVACRNCHAKIDPWGVALEEFNAGGRLKTQPADARSTLPDQTEVSGANDLKRYLANDRIDQLAFSFLKHLSIYAAGRSLTYSELHQLKQDGLKLKADGYRMKNMIRYVVNSPVFLEK
jgi:mono/diheme cytochrome c family protein